MRQTKEGSICVNPVNPKQMYAFLQNSFANLAKKSTGSRDQMLAGTDTVISETFLSEDSFTHEYTQLSIAMVLGRTPYYCIRSTVYIADPKLLQPPHGFYSLDRINRFQEELKDQGLSSSITSKPDSTYTEVVIPGEKNAGVLIEFGPKSKQHLGNLQRDFIEEAPGAIKKLLFKRAIEMANDKLVNPWVNLHLTDSGDLRPSPWCCRLESLESFTGNLRFYAKVYEKVLTALYLESGTQPPLVTFPFRYRPQALSALTG